MSEMLGELREQFLAEFVSSARLRIKQALALMPPSGPGGEQSFESIERLMHTIAGEAAMIGLPEIVTAARAAQSAGKRCLAGTPTPPAALVACARAIRSLALLVEALKPSSPPAAQPATPVAQEEPGGGVGRVLMVDDSPFNTALLSEALVAAGVQARAVPDDLEQAMTQLAEFHPHLVLIDAIMPNLDPKQLCLKIRAHPAGAGARLVLFTALSGAEAAVHAQMLAVDGFVTKDLGVSSIVARVCALLPGARL